MMMLSQLFRELDTLRSQLGPADAALTDLFLRQIAGWKDDRATPRELLESLDRTLGHVWLTRDETHAKVHRLLEEFRSTVQSLGGMTMNERLVTFDLLDRWDRANGDGQRELYSKLEAKI
jgi:hypothetical protein